MGCELLADGLNQAVLVLLGIIQQLLVPEVSASSCPWWNENTVG